MDGREERGDGTTRWWDVTTTRRRCRLGGYREWEAPGDVRRAVEAVWTFRRSCEGGEARRFEGHRVLPHTGASLCFRSLRARDGRCEDGEVVVIGPTRSPHRFMPIPGRHIEAVRVKPEWMRSLLGIDGAEHGDVIVPLESLEGVAEGVALRLRDRLLTTRTCTDAVRILLGHMVERMAAARIERSASLAHEVLEEVRGLDDGDPVDLGRISGAVGVSHRQLRRVVKQQTGLSPKRLQRTDRMNRAVAVADRCDRPPWSRIALDQGYCDQSHLIREVRTFSGLPPAELHRERRRQEITR